MSKLITYIPLSSVERIELRVTNCRKTLSQVKAETKAHYVLNGGMWNPDGSACPLLKVGGVMRSSTPWRAMGYAWDKGPDIHMTSEYEGADNFIAVTALVTSGKPVDKPSYGSAQGDKRGRSAIGLRGGSLALYCSSDGTDAATPEALRDELAGLGWASAVMLDGGGSSQCDFGGERITASRKVHNWICVYLKQAEQTPPEEEDKPMSKHTVCLDPGHGPGNVNGSPDGTYKEWEFTWDMAQRIKPLLEAQGVGVVLTKTTDNYPSLTERANISNKAQPDCFVSIHTNAAGEVPLTIQDPGVSVMGPRVFPYFIGACMVILSLALMLTTIVKHRKAGGADSTGTFASEEERKRALRDELRALLLAAVILVYAALFQILGYFISTLLAATVILLIFRVKKIWAYPVVYAAAVAIWAGFTFLLSVRLP